MATNTLIRGQRKTITFSKAGRHLPLRQPATETQCVLQTKTDRAAAVASEFKVEWASGALQEVSLRRDAPGSTDTAVNNGEALAANSAAPGDPVAAAALYEEVDGSIPPHPLADIFPALDDDALRALAQDIGTHGLREDIVLYQGKILDGRCRYRACELAGVVPRVTQYGGDNPLAFVVSRNLHRRQLSASQRALVAARLADLGRGANQYSEGVPIGRAAKLFNTSERSVARAREVLAHGNPQLVAAVETGERTVASATALARNQVAACSDETEIRLDSPATSTNESLTLAEKPSPGASTMDVTASVQVESPSFAAPPLGEITWQPAFELPKPGVTLLIGGLSAAVLQVAVKISATESTGGSWPNYCTAEMGDVVWLSSQSGAEAILRRQFEAAAACLPRVRFLEAELDDNWLPIRNSSADLRRLRQSITKEGPIKVVVLDYFAEYLRFGDAWQTIPNFKSATHFLQEFAVEHGVAVVLPCLLPTRDDDAITKAANAFGLLEAVNAVFLIKRDSKPNRGTLIRVTDKNLAGPGFSFQLRNRNCVPAVVWDRPHRKY
jgi:hypothetical protein